MPLLGDDEFAAWFRLLANPRRRPRDGAAPAGRLRFARRRACARRPTTLRELAGARGCRRAAARRRRTMPSGWPPRGCGCRAAPSRSVLTLGDAAYPPRLLQAADPPLLLYVQGAPASLSAPAIAIVGSRHPTPQGIDNARAFARRSARRAMSWCRAWRWASTAPRTKARWTAAAGTVAVVGTGLDRVYPAAPPRTGPPHRRATARWSASSRPARRRWPANFPQRNRIIAGLSLGTLVVEAALRVGLADHGAAGGRGRARGVRHSGLDPCAAVQGLPLPAQAGRQAGGVAQDIARGTARRAAPAGRAAAGGADRRSAPADPLLQALGHDPVTLDALMARTGASAAD